MANSPKDLTTIGVFYDGQYFYHVSNYYQYHHQRRARIDISGLHRFIRNKASELMDTDEHLCQIVDAHYFRGRLSAYDAEKKPQMLLNDRIFDDILSREGVTTHYLPLRSDNEGKSYEKGIDVWLALEAFELAFYKRFSMVVLICCDGDYAPLAKKLNTLGIKVMLLGWDLKSANESGDEFFVTRTSQFLLDEVSFPILMHEEIDDRRKKASSEIEGLFYKKRTPAPAQIASEITAIQGKVPSIGTVTHLFNGYGFISDTKIGDSIFFHYNSLTNIDFNDITLGMEVEFNREFNTRKQQDNAVDVVVTSPFTPSFNNPSDKNF